MRLVRLALPLGVAVALALTTASARPAASPGFTIASLHASLVRMHSTSAPWGVRIRVRVCFPTLAVAERSVPRTVTIGHYLVQKHRWWNARTTVDHPPWVVTFGESGTRCSTHDFDDAIPDEHYGVESIGNPLGCYGVSFALQVDRTVRRRRTIVTCKPRFR